MKLPHKLNKTIFLGAILLTGVLVNWLITIHEFNNYKLGCGRTHTSLSELEECYGVIDSLQDKLDSIEYTVSHKSSIEFEEVKSRR